MKRITAVFNNDSSADQAVQELRRLGLTDTHMGFVGPHAADLNSNGTPRTVTAPGTSTHPAGGMLQQDVGEGAGRGLAVGATAGALFGIAAALIPGVGPFITAGALASTLGAVGGGAVAGALVGGTTGTLAGAFAQAGYQKDEAEYYGNEVQGGGTLVSIDLADESHEAQVRQIIAQYGGRSYSGTADVGGMASSAHSL